MQTIGNYHAVFFPKERDAIIRRFNSWVKLNIGLPAPLMPLVFPETFFSNLPYLVYPYFFRKAFDSKSTDFLNRLSISGFLYFKYLICIDGLIDRDVAENQENNVPDAIIASRCHVYHEESIKILGGLFIPQSTFWKIWKQRNEAFYRAVMLDKQYDPDMPFEVYKQLAVSKCAFLKATLDGLYCRLSPAITQAGKRRLYRALLKSFDHLAIGTCLLDDFEDFKKDLAHQKNNHANMLLKQWLATQGKSLDATDPSLMEKYFFTSTMAEKVLDKSKEQFVFAIQALARFEEFLPEFIRYLEAFRNKSNLLKVNIQAYRISAQVEKVKLSATHKFDSVQAAIQNAGQYIQKLQHPDGSWFDISNKQGLSNVWSTAFIAMNLDPASAPCMRAARFLKKNKQYGLWGYNTDWIPDFDSTTCSLAVLNQAKQNIDPYLEAWWKGQQATGGFSTYGNANRALVSYLGIENKAINNDWTREHVCVSALAYYFLAGVPNRPGPDPRYPALKKYLLKHASRDGLWKPYWWTSVIYPTTFIVKGLMREGAPEDRELVDASMKALLARQQADGAFACDVLHASSVFYTALVLDTLCQQKGIFNAHAESAHAMASYICSNQHEDGAFENANFLVIPSYQRNNAAAGESLTINKAGGGGSITGEVAGLFSTSVAHRALSRYRALTNEA